jgi:hypothetical protein
VSVLTSTPLKSAPSGAAGVAITTGAAPAFGAWVEIITSTAAPIAIAGVEIFGGSYSDSWWELDLGTGAASAEVSVGTLRLYLYNSGSGTIPTGVLLPVPLGGIGAGVRVAVRARSTSGAPTNVALNYYENLSSDQVTTSSQVLSSAPSGAGTASLTPNATAWANSAWVQLLASAPADLGLFGLAHGVTPNAAAGGVEYDLGTGAAGSEVVVTTLRDAANGGFGSKLCCTWLPGIYPITAGTRLAVRMRKSDTSTSAHPIAVLYYSGVSAVPDARVSQLVVETLSHDLPPVPAVTQLVVETLSSLVATAPDARVSQLVVETLTSTPVQYGWVSQLVVETLTVSPAPRLSQLVVETLTASPVPRVPIRATQLVAEVLNTIPLSPLAATQVAAELVLALPPQPNQTRVTQLVCELIVVPVVLFGCPGDFPIDEALAGSGCPTVFTDL